MKIKFLIPILLIVFIFSFSACTTSKTATETTIAETTGPETTIAETTVPETAALPVETTSVTVVESTVIEEPNITIIEISDSGLEMIFKSCLESSIAVEAGFTDGDFACTAKPGMKFEIIFYEFKNTGSIRAETPIVGNVFEKDKDVMITNSDSEYPIWSTGWAHNEEDYNRREATSEEIIKFIGRTASLETLEPGGSAEGCVVFEIPFDETPKSIKLLIGDKPYQIDITKEFIIQDPNLEEREVAVTDIETNIRNIIKDFTEETLEGQLTKFVFEGDTIQISYNSKWSSEDTIKKEMFNLVTIFSGSDYPDLYNVIITATGNLSGDSYKSTNTKEILLILHNYQMDYPEWLEETF